MTKNIPKTGVLFSGGLDSAGLISCFLNRGHRVYPIYVQMGFPWERQEIAWGQKFLRSISSKNLKKLLITQLPLASNLKGNWANQNKTPGWHTRDSAVFLPARNLLLLSKSSVILAQKNVWRVCIGTLRGNPFPDGQPAYFEKLEKLISAGLRKPFRILAPFTRLTKSEVLKLAHQFPIHLSLSCLNPIHSMHCGKCNKCAERFHAFRKAKVIDRTRYATVPLDQ